MDNLVKNIEKRLESVRKEREMIISIIEGVVKETYNKQDIYGQGNSSFVGLKMYGSMASKLAIE
jgi:hypothetical protein